MAEELGEVREVIRRRKERGSEGGGRRSGTWESERWTTPHASRRRERTSAKTLAQSIESQSNKGKTDVEMRSLKGRKEGRKEGGQTDSLTRKDILIRSKRKGCRPRPPILVCMLEAPSLASCRACSAIE